MKSVYVFLTAVVLAAPQQVFGAIGCTLSNPAQDLKYLYPEMTTYKEDLNEFPRLKDGASLFKALRERLGSDLECRSAEQDLEHSLSPSYPRALIRQGSTAWAAIGAPTNGAPVDNILSFGLIWLSLAIYSADSFMRRSKAMG